MNLDSVDPQLRSALRWIPRMDYSRPLVRMVGRVGPRLLWTPPVRGVKIRWIKAGSLRLRVYTLMESSARSSSGSGAAAGADERAARMPGLLWIHGGGLVIGSAYQDDKLCTETASALGVVVVSVEYRLAPENPYPAAIDDVWEAWGWIQDNAGLLGIDTCRVAVGGESAGGGLAACLAQRLHDSPDVTQPVAQWLFAPMLDDRPAAQRELDILDHPIWNNVANRQAWFMYLGVPTGADPVGDYAVAARRSDLSGLPPAWLYTGDIELFYDEVVEYAARLEDAGVETTLVVVPGVPHGFENWARNSALARSLVMKAQEWLGARLA